MGHIKPMSTMYYTYTKQGHIHTNLSQVNRHEQDTDVQKIQAVQKCIIKCLIKLTGLAYTIVWTKMNVSNR